jgi:hypothetical protein
MSFAVHFMRIADKPKEANQNDKSLHDINPFHLTSDVFLKTEANFSLCNIGATLVIQAIAIF